MRPVGIRLFRNYLLFCPMPQRCKYCRVRVPHAWILRAEVTAQERFESRVCILVFTKFDRK